MTTVGVLAFVIVKDGVTDAPAVLFEGLRSLVKTAVGSFAVPQHFLVITP